MSMSLVTLFQFLQTLAAYLFLTLALPCAFLNKKLSQYRFMNRVLLYFIIGNFYATNLVFLLQLLHISNWFTLWIGLLIIPAAIGEWRNQFPILDRMRSLGHSGRKLLTGSLGIRSAVDSLWRKVRRLCVRGLKRAGKHWLDWLLVIALVLMVMWVYGIRMLRDLGYGASDIAVHMYWVNSMHENHIFVAGIYPHGMHAVIYLINELFGIDTYAIFRVFALVQCLAIHMMALLVLKLCCKSRYAAYTGVFLYAISKVFTAGYFWRYHSTLPQEYSMIYILPSAYFACYFFQEKRRELKEFKQSEESGDLEESEDSEESGESEELTERRKRWKSRKSKKLKKNIPGKSSRMALAGLVMSFSLCVTAHFYGAIMAALFCIGIAIGYMGWLVRPVYFNRIAAAGLISLTVAVLPMGIAFAMGTSLEGSLRWATSVIRNSIPQEEQQAPDSFVQAPDYSLQTPDLPAQPGDAQNAEAGAAAPPAEGQDGAPAAEPAFSAPKPSRLEAVKRVFLALWEAIGDKLAIYISRDAGASAWWCSRVLRGMIVFLAVAGAVLLLSPARTYGAMLLSTGTFMILMSLMYASKEIGIPSLMDEERSLLFFCYGLIMVIGLAVDVCVWAVTCMFRSRWPRDILSIAVVAALGVYVWQQDMIRSPLAYDGIESNEAITCLANIIATEKDYSWTIVSANDETQMVYGHGYHYEPITFLYEIETLSNDTVTLPTKSVYFFIEKIPVYYWSYGFVQPVSREGAEAAVPRGTGLDIYKGRNRWIVMSHMYYWAQEFQRLYPNEMKVYLETEDFVCYRLEQNTYRLYDLAIDYGYNSVKSEGR